MKGRAGAHGNGQWGMDRAFSGGNQEGIRIRDFEEGRGGSRVMLRIIICWLLYISFFSFFWSGLQGPKAYSLWGGVVPSPCIGYEYL